MTNAENLQSSAELWEAYQTSFRQFAQQASFLNFEQEQDTVAMLALEEARAAYNRARDAVALSLLESTELPVEAQCACV